MPFIPHTRADTDAMLEAIGVGAIDDLFAEIPAELKLQALEGIPGAIGESEVGRLMRAARPATKWRSISSAPAPTNTTSRRRCGN